MCGCTGKVTVPRRAPAAVLEALAMVRKLQLNEGDIQMVYCGPREREFYVMGGVSHQRYFVPGPGGIVEINGIQKILPADMGWFCMVNRGLDYKIMDPEPEPEPEVEELEPEVEESEEEEFDDD